MRESIDRESKRDQLRPEFNQILVDFVRHCLSWEDFNYFIEKNTNFLLSQFPNDEHSFEPRTDFRPVNQSILDFFKLLFADFVRSEMPELETQHGGTRHSSLSPPAGAFRRVLDLFLEALCEHKMQEEPEEIENDLADFLKKVFWGFCYVCFFHKRELRLLFAVVGRLDPEGASLRVLRGLAGHLRTTSSPAQVFFDSILTKLVLALTVVDLNHFVADVNEKDRVGFFDLVRDLHHEVYSFDVGTICELVKKSTSTVNFSKNKIRMNYLNMASILDDNFCQKFSERDQQEHSYLRNNSSIRESTTAQICESTREDHRSSPLTENRAGRNGNPEPHHPRRAGSESRMNQVYGGPTGSATANHQVLHIENVIIKKWSGKNHMPELSSFKQEIKFQKLIESVSREFPEFEQAMSNHSESRRQDLETKAEGIQETQQTGRKLLEFFLGKADEGQVSTAYLINAVFEFPVFDVTIIEKVRNTLNNSEGRPDTREKRQDYPPQSQRKPPRTGLFFEFWYKINNDLEALGEHKKNAFQELLRFIGKLMFREVLSRRPMGLHLLHKCKVFFEIFEAQSDHLEELVGKFVSDYLYILHSEKKKKIKKDNKNMRTEKKKKYHMFDYLTWRKSPSLVKRNRKLRSLKDIESNQHLKRKWVLSWVLNCSKETVRTIVIDKFFAVWSNFERSHLEKKYLKEDGSKGRRLDIQQLRRSLDKYVSDYQNLYQWELVHARRVHTLFGSWPATSLEGIRQQTRKYFSSQVAGLNQNEVDKSTIDAFRFKQIRLKVILKKVEKINAIRQLGKLVQAHCSSLAKEDFEVLAKSVLPERQGQIKDTVRIYLLTLIETKVKLLDNYQEKFIPIFPELKELKMEKVSLAGTNEWLDDYEYIQRKVEDPQSEIREKVRLVRNGRNFVLFTTVILNKLLANQDQQDQFVLDQNYKEIIHAFEEDPIKASFLKNLSKGFSESEYLRIDPGLHATPSFPQRILLINILTWVIATGQKNPFFLILKDLNSGQIETNNFLFNVSTDGRASTDRERVTDHYVVHDPNQEAPIEGLRAHEDTGRSVPTRVPEVSRFWHLLMHGFYLAVSDSQLFTSNKLLKDIENDIKKKQKLSKMTPKEYLFDHFRRDWERFTPGVSSKIGVFLLETLADSEEVSL